MESLHGGGGRCVGRPPSSSHTVSDSSVCPFVHHLAGGLDWPTGTQCDLTKAAGELSVLCRSSAWQLAEIGIPTDSRHPPCCSDVVAEKWNLEVPVNLLVADVDWTVKRLVSVRAAASLRTQSARCTNTNRIMPFGVIIAVWL